MPDRHTRLLGESLVQAVDSYFEARRRLVDALVAGDGETARQANAESKRLLADWMALLVERLDGRTAALLVDVLQRLETLESLLLLDAPAPPAPLAVEPERDHGHDEMGLP